MIDTAFTIATARCKLRKVSRSDIPFAFSASRHEGFCDGMRWNPPVTEDELIAPLEANEAAWLNGAAYAFTIERRDDAQPVGRIGIRSQPGRSWDLGFWIHPSYQGQGYMTEATIAILAFGFTRLDASEIQAGHTIWNRASRRVLEKAGLRFIRHNPQGFQKNGEWIAVDLVAITLDEWTHQKTEPLSQENHRQLPRS